MRVVAVVIVVGLALPAAADKPMSPAERTKAAKAAYLEGKRAYDTGRFEEAVAHFERAYGIKPAPLLLFNIGQCYRGMGNHEKAAFLFRRYLSEDPRSKERRLVEELIADSEAKAEEERQLELERVRRSMDFERLEREFHEKLEALRMIADEGLTEEELARKEADLLALQERQTELAQLRREMEGLAPEPANVAPEELLARQAALEEQAKAAAARQAELEKLAAQLKADQEALRAEREADIERQKAAPPVAHAQEPQTPPPLESDDEGAWWLWPAVGGGAAGVAALALAGMAGGVAVFVVAQAAQPQYNHTLDWRE